MTCHLPRLMPPRGTRSRSFSTTYGSRGVGVGVGAGRRGAGGVRGAGRGAGAITRRGALRVANSGAGVRRGATRCDVLQPARSTPDKHASQAILCTRHTPFDTGPLVAMREMAGAAPLRRATIPRHAPASIAIGLPCRGAGGVVRATRKPASGIPGVRIEPARLLAYRVSTMQTKQRKPPRGTGENYAWTRKRSSPNSTIF